MTNETVKIGDQTYTLKPAFSKAVKTAHTQKLYHYQEYPMVIASVMEAGAHLQDAAQYAREILKAKQSAMQLDKTDEDNLLQLKEAKQIGEKLYHFGRWLEFQYCNTNPDKQMGDEFSATDQLKIREVMDNPINLLEAAYATAQHVLALYADASTSVAQAYLSRNSNKKFEGFELPDELASRHSVRPGVDAYHKALSHKPPEGQDTPFPPDFETVVHLLNNLKQKAAAIPKPVVNAR